MASTTPSSSAPMPSNEAEAATTQTAAAASNNIATTSHEQSGEEGIHETTQVQAEFNDSSTSETNNKLFVEIKVPKVHFEKYKLNPMVISQSRIEFMNAKDTTYYRRELKNPMLMIWILSNGSSSGESEDPEDRPFSYTQKRLFENAWKQNIQVKIVQCTKLDLVVSQEGLEHILYEGVKVEKLPDAVLPRLGAKVTYFSLAVVRQFEKMGVLVLNPNSSLEISRDKLYTLQTLGAHNMPIPKTMIAKFPLQKESVEKNFSFPCILKKSSGSQGKGVMLIQNMEHLNDVADMIDVSKPLIFQEYISNSSGRDIRVIVVGGKAVGGMMRIAKKGFKSNFHQGGYVKPVKLSPAVEWLAIESVKLIGLDVAGVDILIDRDTYKICEINSSPGFKGFEMATGVDVAASIVDFIRLRTGTWKKTNEEKPKVKKLVMIPVHAEHILPPPVPSERGESASSTPSSSPPGTPHSTTSSQSFPLETTTKQQ